MGLMEMVGGNTKLCWLLAAMLTTLIGAARAENPAEVLPNMHLGTENRSSCVYLNNKDEFADIAKEVALAKGVILFERDLDEFEILAIRCGPVLIFEFLPHLENEFLTIFPEDQITPRIIVTEGNPPHQVLFPLEDTSLNSWEGAPGDPNE